MSSDSRNAANPAPEVRAGHTESLAARARQLRAASASGSSTPGLAGRNLGLLCDDPADPTISSIHGAAVGLGARVSLVRPRFDPADVDTIAGTARMLGRLYDGVVCFGLPPALVQALRQAAGIPVLDGAFVAAAPGIAATEPHHPTVGGDDLRFLWQAALIDGLG